MTRARRLACAACALGLAGALACALPPRAAAAPASQAAPAPAAQPADDGEAQNPRAELRAALRDFYLAELTRELGLSPERAAALTPKVVRLLDAHRESGRERLAASLALRRAASGAGDPAGALALFQAAETRSAAAVAAARQDALATLSPAEQARLLAFERPFRQRVRSVIAAARGGDTSAPAAAAEEPQDGADDVAPQADGSARSEMRETLELMFAHRLRTELGLDDARTLALLPSIDALFEAHAAAARSRAQALARLGDAVTAAGAASGPPVPEDQLRRLLAQALQADADAHAGITAARSKLLGGLSPKEACQAVLLEQRMLSGGRRLLRDAGSLSAGRGGGAGGEWRRERTLRRQRGGP